MKIALFDYGAGNLHSLGKALEAGGARVTVTSRWSEALALDALVLPGVGAFGAAVKSLGTERARVREALEGGLPCLGICLGMQLFFHDSAEGEGEGIGFLSGTVRRLRTHIVPQMGWNDVSAGLTTSYERKAGSPDPLFAGLEELVAYFANSYVCQPTEPGTVIATSTYQGDLFPAAVHKVNTWGVQFHPEKSSGPGLRLISNFLREARSYGGVS
jgi:imidazole glycerol-phosphate synthase subunit HisH